MNKVKNYELKVLEYETKLWKEMIEKFKQDLENCNKKIKENKLDNIK